MKRILGEDVLIVDAHAHIWDEFKGERFGDTKLESLGYGKIRQNGEILDLVPSSFADNIASMEIFSGYMESAGIDKAVILQNPCYGDQREYVREVMRRFPDKILATAGKIDPRNTDTLLTEIDVLTRDFGCMGVKMEIPDVPFVMDDPKYDFCWKKIMDDDLLAVIDLGWGQGAYDFAIEPLTRVVQKYPAMRMCLAHLGVSRLWDSRQQNPYPELQKVLRLFDINRDNLCMDISAMPFFSVEDEHPDPRGQDILRTVHAAIGADKLLFGTDFPSVLKLRTMRQCVDFVVNHCGFLSSADKKNILGLNALRVYGRRG